MILFLLAHTMNEFLFPLLGEEVNIMSKNQRNRGKAAGGVNPQGYGQDADITPSPKSKLENAAKKKNTK